jgi:hypothetical protein
MKTLKILPAFLFSLLMFAGSLNVAYAQTAKHAPTMLTKAERKQLTDYLKSSRDLVLTSVKGLSEEQMNFKAAPEKWSVREVVQHLALAENFLFDMIQNQVMKSPEITAEKRAEVAGAETKIMQLVPDRSKKVSAPEPIVPSDSRVPGDAVATFKTRRNNTIKFIKDTKEDLRGHFLEGPGLGAADGWQWFFLIAAHSVRHDKQIEEVKANPNFPKK